MAKIDDRIVERVNSSPRVKAIAAMAKLSPETQTAHAEAWARCESFVRSLIKPGAKVFEAHHAIEHARGIYQAGLAQYHAPDHCERLVRAAYPGCV